MSVSINTKRCTGCSLCIPVCPDKTLTIVDKKVKVTGSNCMICGHCQAACPVDAIRIGGLTTLLGLKHITEKKGTTDPEEFDCATLVQLMRSRRSCRNYLSRHVELSLLEDLVKIGTTAPSGTNSQAWNFVILPTRRDVELFGDGVASFYRSLNQRARNPFYRFLARVIHGNALERYYKRYYAQVEEALKEWEEAHVDRLFHGAVAAIVVLGDNAASCPAEDTLLATENILLAAQALGLGSCLIGFAVDAVRRKPKLKTLLHIGDHEEIYAVVALGYPNEHYCQPAGRKVVKPKIVNLKNETDIT